MERRLSDWISGFLKYTENTEPPYTFRLWTALHTVAAVLQRKCYLPWGSLTFYPNMYIVLVAPPGAARKGTAMGPSLDLLSEPNLGIKLAAEAITREALIRELKNANDTIINQQTGEMLLHSSLTIHSQELTVFLGYHNYQLMSDLADWYDCRKRWTYRTKWSGTDDIIGVWVNIIGATTPELIQESLPMDAIGGGLTSRMVFVYEERRAKSVADPFLSKEELELHDKLVIDLEMMKMLTGPFRVTDDFVDFWIKWYPEQEFYRPFDDPRFSGYFERRPTHVMKMAMLLNASRGNNMTINKEDLTKAIGILELTEKKMFYTFKGVGKSRFAEVLTKIMAYVGRKKQVPYSELINVFMRDVTKFDLDKIIETLEAMKFCKLMLPAGIITYNDGYEGNYAQKMNIETTCTPEK